MEYLRALRYELGVLPAFDQVQVCTPANRDYLLTLPAGAGAAHAAGLRAGIDTVAVRIPQLRARAADHAVSRQFPARPEPRRDGLVRRRMCCR